MPDDGAELVTIDAANFSFSEDEAYALLAEVQQDLTDLQYLDKATEFLDDLEDSTILERAVRPGEIEAQVTVSLGAKYPFNRTLKWREYSNWAFWQTEQRLNESLAEIHEAAKDWATGEASMMRSRLDHLTRPSGKALLDAIDGELAEVQRGLRLNIDPNFGNLRKLAKWEGIAAEDFHTNFYEPFGEMRENQVRLVESLRAASQHAYTVAHVAQYSAMNILRTALAALDEQLQAHSQGAAGTLSKKDTLAVAAGVTGIGSAMTITFAPLSSALALSSGALQLASALQPDKGAVARVPLRGANAEEISISTLDRLRDVLVYRERSNDELNNDLGTVSGEIEKLRRSKKSELVPRRPLLADGEVDPDHFHHESAER